MTTDLDSALRRLHAEDHPGLSAMEAEVMARIHERRRTELAFGTPLIALAAFGAAALGMTAGAVRPATAAAAPLSPLGPSNPLAPSTLLAVDR